MSYHYEKETGDIVIDGFEKGIASSPHSGIGNMQCVDTYTELGEVMNSYSRVLDSQSGDTSTNHSGSATDTSHLSTSFTLLVGQWITISASSVTGLSTGDYYVIYSNGSPTVAATSFQISSSYGGSQTTWSGSSGSITFNLKAVMSNPIQGCIEEYINSNGAQYRYYVLDTKGLVWVYDTAALDNLSNPITTFFLPDTTIPDGLSTTLATGLAVYDGWLHQFKGSLIWVKSTAFLGINGSTGSTGWTQFPKGPLQTFPTSPNPHYAITSQGELLYTDTNFVGAILAISNSGAPTNANLWSYGSVTYDSSGNFTFTSVGGQLPIVNQTIMFITNGTLPTGLTAGDLYYVYSVDKSALGTTGVFKFTVGTGVGSGQVTSLSGGSGTLYVNSYNPAYSAGEATYSWSPTALLLPSSEVAKNIAVLGTNYIIGGVSSTMYLWDGVQTQPTGFIYLPEANVQGLLTVNIVVYAFVGNKGNIYVTNGSSTSLAMTVPDYTAGIPGTPTSYFEPYFVWGGQMILRGRVYFSIQDQTSSKTGNCGGIWSFVPSFFNPVTGQDTGLSLRLENENSYGTFNGMAPVLLPLQNQKAIAPQYFSAWTSDQSSASATYGIDGTGTSPSQASGGLSIIETDIIPTGTILGRQKKTFGSIEFKLSAPLVSGESVALKYRQNLTDAWASLGTVNMDSSNLSGVYQSLPFQSGQWLQLQATMTPTATNPSFCRLTEIRIHE